MAVTLETRAGSTLRAQVHYWQPDRVELVNTSGYTARLQMRSAQGSGRVLIDTREYTGVLPAPSGTIFTRLEPGHWRIVLGRSVTRTLPPVVRFEVELENDTDPEDVTFLFDGVIRVTPESVVVTQP